MSKNQEDLFRKLLSKDVILWEFITKYKLQMIIT